MSLDWVLRFLIAWVSRENPTLNYISEQRYLFLECWAFKLCKTRFWLWDTDYPNHSLTQTGKNDGVETLHPTQNLLLHLPGHLTSDIFYSLSFLEQNHNKMGIWPFSSLFPFPYSWSLQSSAKHYLKPHSGPKVLITAASWPPPSEYCLVLRHLNSILLSFCLPSSYLLW